MPGRGAPSTLTGVNEHYFTADPGSAGPRRELRLTLGGREVVLHTSGGTFSPERLDAGTSVLLREAPAPPATGTFLDLGCGWGPVALDLALRSPGATVWAVDVNERARALTAENAVAAGVGDRVRVAAPQDVPADVTVDLLWSNPPIRVGKAVLHGMLEQWLPRLAPDGEAWLVVQKNLGSDSLQRWVEDHDGVLAPFGCERAATGRGYRVLRVARR